MDHYAQGDHWFRIRLAIALQGSFPTNQVVNLIKVNQVVFHRLGCNIEAPPTIIVSD